MKLHFAREITEALELTGQAQETAVQQLLHWFREDEHIVWTVTDVVTQAEIEGRRITDEQAAEVLQKVIREHNAHRGINWDTISAHLKSFPEWGPED